MLSPILADGIDATGWTVIISAVFLGIMQVMREVLAFIRERDKIKRETAIAVQVAAVHDDTVKVKEDLATAHQENVVRLEGQKQITEKLEQQMAHIERSTNGTQVALIELASREGHARGKLEGVVGETAKPHE